MATFALLPATTAQQQVTETIVRGNATANVAPTVAEFATPTARDRAAVMLTDGSIEFWTHASGA